MKQMPVGTKQNGRPMKSARPFAVKKKLIGVESYLAISMLASFSVSPSTVPVTVT
jgi:hypothetical protein